MAAEPIGPRYRLCSDGQSPQTLGLPVGPCGNPQFWSSRFAAAVPRIFCQKRREDPGQREREREGRYEALAAKEATRRACPLFQLSWRRTCILRVRIRRVPPAARLDRSLASCAIAASFFNSPCLLRSGRLRARSGLLRSALRRRPGVRSRSGVPLRWWGGGLPFC